MIEVLMEIVVGYKMATKILETQRKIIFLEKKMLKKHPQMPIVTQGSPNLIRESGRTELLLLSLL